MSATLVVSIYRWATAAIGTLYLGVGLWEYWLSGMYRLIVLGLLTLALGEIALLRHRRFVRRQSEKGGALSP